MWPQINPEISVAEYKCTLLLALLLSITMDGAWAGEFSISLIQGPRLTQRPHHLEPLAGPHGRRAVGVPPHHVQSSSLEETYSILLANPLAEVVTCATIGS